MCVKGEREGWGQNWLVTFGYRLHSMGSTWPQWIPSMFGSLPHQAHSLAGVKQLSLTLRAAVQGEGEGEGEERGFYRVSGTLGGENCSHVIC